MSEAAELPENPGKPEVPTKAVVDALKTMKQAGMTLSPEQDKAIVDFEAAQASALDVAAKASGATAAGVEASANFLAKLKANIADIKPTADPEIMEGSEKGSKYLVIAKKNGVRLGIRPLITPVKAKTPWMLIGFRLRVEGMKNAEDSVIAQTVFDLPFQAKEKSLHRSLVAGTKLSDIPGDVLGAKRLWDKEGYTAKVVADLFTKLSAQDVDFTVTLEQLTEYVQSGYDDQLPDYPVKPIEFKLDYEIGVQK